MYKKYQLRDTILKQPVAEMMGLDTSNPTTLWKDKALVALNVAVLHSFKACTGNVQQFSQRIIAK